MRIVVNTNNYEILNSIIREAKISSHTIAIAKLESTLFEHIYDEDGDAYILANDNSNTQKAIDFIKKTRPYIPILIIGINHTHIHTNADYMTIFSKDVDTTFFAKTMLYNLSSYAKNFETLQKLTAKIGGDIIFGDCKFDPTRRTLYFNDVMIKKFSPKQAGILELLAANFGKVVRKDIMQEKVWHQSNYFVGRSLDVFVTHIRKALKDANTGITVYSITNTGLMLNFVEHKNL